jgi:hypothetical protein
MEALHCIVGDLKREKIEVDILHPGSHLVVAYGSMQQNPVDRELILPGEKGW